MKMFPLAIATIGLMALHEFLMRTLGGDSPVVRLALALRGDGPLSAWETGLLFLDGLMTAMEGAVLIAVGLSLWSRDGTASTWGEARLRMRGRWMSVVGAGAIITLLWGLPWFLGIMVIANGNTVGGTLLVFLALGILVYVTGRRYLAMALALYEDMPAFRSFRESRRRLLGRRRSVAMAVFLLVLPIVPLVKFMQAPIASLQAALAEWPSLRAAIPLTWSALLTVAETALLSRLAWQVYHDLSRMADELPPISLSRRVWASMRLTWLSWKGY